MAANIAALGDLGGDGVGNAVAVLSLELEGPDRARYLVACLFDDGVLRPSAGRFIGEGRRDLYAGSKTAPPSCICARSNPVMLPAVLRVAAALPWSSKKVNLCEPSEFNFYAQPTTHNGGRRWRGVVGAASGSGLPSG